MRIKIWKAKIDAIWRIICADGFDVATTYPSPCGYGFWSISCFGRDNAANALHNRIGDLFNHIHWVIKVGKKDMKDEADK